MIRLFDKDETNFDSNGLGVLDSEIKENVVEEKMNGIYNFDFAYLSKGKHANQLEGDMIVKAPTPDGDQLFRIYKVTKNIGYLEVNCYHIFYDLAGNFIEDINIVSQSGQAAITHFGTGLQYATRFKFVSNIVIANSARLVRLNAVQALLDSSQDNSFLSRWGGEIKRDNFTVYMNDVRGNDKGFKIRHGKNLTGYEANIDYSSVVTRIMPYGYDGLMLPEKYVDSPLRGKYAFTRIKKIEYTNIKAIDPDATSNDEGAVPLEEAYKLLRQAAELEYSVNKVDIPTSNFKVTFKNLSDTKEYADFKALEKVEPWDCVTVIADNLDIKSRMISYKYDAITKAYKEVELGNYVPSFTDIGSKVDHATNLANQANDTANTAAESANGKNSNYHGPSEPSRPVDGDLWYKKNGDKTELWQYDGKSVPPGWKLIVDDATGEEIRQNVDAAQKEAEEANKQANKAVDGANDAVAKAGFANDTATQAKSDAAAAGQQAKNALTDAGTALTNAKTALDNVTKLDQTVKTEVTNINGQLAQKVNQTTFDTLKGTVTSQGTLINQNKAAIQLKADLSLVNTIKQTVTNNTAAIDLNSKEIKLKTSQSDVDKLGGRVTNAEAQIKLQADQIALTVSKTELTNILGDYATETWTQSQIKQTADSINLSVSKVQNEVDGFNNKGRNYFLNSNFQDGTSKWNVTKDGLTVVADTNTFKMGTKSAIHIYGTANKEFQGFRQDFMKLPYDLQTVKKGTKLYLSALLAKDGAPTSNLHIGIHYCDGNGKILGQVWHDIPASAIINGVATRKSLEFIAPVDFVQVNVMFYVVKGLEANYWITETKLESYKQTPWSLAPEDQVTEVQFSQLQITVNGIQGTVQNKADQSQVTQLAGQVTSVVSTANGNSSQITQLSKDINLRVTADQVDASILANKTIKDTRDDNQPPSWYYANYPKQTIKELKRTSTIGIADGSYAQLTSEIAWTDKSVPIKQTARTNMQTSQRFSTSETTWSSWSTIADTSNVISQINISPESILIAGQKVHITGQTRIDNAVIKDAMIANVKADKITAGTINGANVNVINLNANNITTGTIKGANLSLNLNTGEVVFQHGRIHSTSNNVDVNIDQGYLSVANGNTRVLLKNGGIQFVQPTIFDEMTNPYLSISNGGSGLAFSGARIVGRDYVVMANNANSSNIFDSPLGGVESFAGISAGYDGARWHPTKIGGAERGIILSAGKKLSSALSWVGGSASIRIGSDGSHGWNSNRIELVGEYVHSLPTYVKTASGSANVIVSPDGALVRSTSASKYKTDIIRTNIPDYGEKLLNLPTATWMDIAETKRFRDDPTTQPEPTRNFGMIAEDLADAGLEMLVVRGTDGELEGINYDRIGPALIPVIAKLKNEVEILKRKLEENQHD